MGQYTELKQTIDEKINTNGNQEITGEVLNGVLNLMVELLGNGATFAGMAHTNLVPEETDAKVFYVATVPGTYSGFGELVVPKGTVAVFTNVSGTWEMVTSQVVGAPSGNGGEIFNDYENNTAGYKARSSGQNNKASGNYSSADGANNTASGDYSSVRGLNNTASGSASSAEGANNTSAGQNAHTEGASNTNNAPAGHVEGYKNTAQNDSEHAEGRYNASHSGDTDAQRTRHSIGIGLNDSGRKNAVEVMENGDKYIIGVGGYDGTNPGAAGVKTLQKAVKRTQPAGLVIGRAIPMRPMPGMWYYTDCVRVRPEDIERFGTIDVTSFGKNGTRARHLDECGRFRTPKTIPADGLITSSFFPDGTGRILIDLNEKPGYCNVYKVSIDYDRSRPITKNDLSVVTDKEYLKKQSTSPNLSLIRIGDTGNGNEYTVMVNKPCHSFAPNYFRPRITAMTIDLSAPLRLNSREQQNPWYRVYYHRVSNHSKHFVDKDRYYINDKLRMIRTKYKRKHGGIIGYGLQQYVKRSAYHGRIWIYKKFRNRFYRMSEIEVKTGNGLQILGL